MGVKRIATAAVGGAAGLFLGFQIGAAYGGEPVLVAGLLGIGGAVLLWWADRPAR